MRAEVLAAALDEVAPQVDKGEDEAPPAGSRVAGPGLQLLRVATSDLVADPGNLRSALTEIEELADSISQAGLLQPPIVRRDGDQLVVVCGHRRLAAIRLLGWPTVDVVVRREMPTDQVLVAMLTENGQRVALDPVEEARALNRLKVVERLTDAQLAVRVGRAQGHVSSRLALLSLSATEQEELRAGQRTIGHSVRMGRVKAGKVRNRDAGAGWHLSLTHPLASKARARCVRLEHPVGHRLGKVACGACGESVIRADERRDLHDHSARTGECALCGQPNPGGVRVAPGAPVPGGASS